MGDSPLKSWTIGLLILTTVLSLAILIAII